jgi:hypothetical protein
MNTRRPITMALAILLGLCILGNVSAAAFTNDDPTVVELDSVEAIPGVAQVEVRWTTLTELDTVGFNVMRSTSADGPWEQANDLLVWAQGSGLRGADYRFPDTGLTGGITYYYYIQGVKASDPMQKDDYTDYICSATPRHGSYLPFISK